MEITFPDENSSIILLPNGIIDLEVKYLTKFLSPKAKVQTGFAQPGGQNFEVRVCYNYDWAQ